APASPSTTVRPSARATKGRRSPSPARLVTATPTCPNSRARIVTVRTTSTKRPRPSGSRKRLWITTRAKATGVEIPRNSSVSTVLRPTRPAPGISVVRRTLFGVTGGAASVPGEGLTAVVTTGREVGGRLLTSARLQLVATSGLGAGRRSARTNQ